MATRKPYTPKLIRQINRLNVILSAKKDLENAISRCIFVSEKRNSPPKYPIKEITNVKYYV